jgi:hypothetical protein
MLTPLKADILYIGEIDLSKLEYSWAFYIHKKLCRHKQQQLTPAYLTKQDISFDFIIRNLNQTLSTVSPKAVIMVLTDQILNQKEFSLTNIVKPPTKRVFKISTHQRLLADVDYLKYQIEKNLALLDLLLKSNGIKNAYVFSSTDYSHSSLTNQTHYLLDNDTPAISQMWNHLENKDLI